MTAHVYRAWLVIAAVTLPVFSACDKKLPVSPSSPAGLASITTLATANTTADPPGQPPSNGPIAFVSDRDGAQAIYLANADGTGVARLRRNAWRERLVRRLDANWDRHAVWAR
jgi:hypothetical protein